MLLGLVRLYAEQARLARSARRGIEEPEITVTPAARETFWLLVGQIDGWGLDATTGGRLREGAMNFEVLGEQEFDL